MMKKCPVSGEIGGAVRWRGHIDFRGLCGWRQMLSSLRIACCGEVWINNRADVVSCGVVPSGLTVREAPLTFDGRV